MHFLFQACANSKEKRKWQQETGILRLRHSRRSHLHQTISIGFDSEPNICFELGCLKQLVSFQIFLRKKRERNQGVRVTRYYSHKTVRINPRASHFSLPFSSNRRKTPGIFGVFIFFLRFFFTCLQHRLKKSALSTCPTLDAHCCAQTPRIEPLTELHTSLTPQGVRMERGSRVNVSKTGPGPICTQQVWHLSVKTSHHAKAHPLCQSSLPRLWGKR